MVPIDPLETNADFLQMLLRVDICWVDDISSTTSLPGRSHSFAILRSALRCLSLGVHYTRLQAQSGMPQILVLITRR